VKDFVILTLSVVEGRNLLSSAAATKQIAPFNYAQGQNDN